VLVDQGTAILGDPDPENEDTSIGLAKVFWGPETQKPI
jgi:hypothetical protein